MDLYSSIILVFICVYASCSKKSLIGEITKVTEKDTDQSPSC